MKKKRLEDVWPNRKHDQSLYIGIKGMVICLDHTDSFPDSHVTFKEISIRPLYCGAIFRFGSGKKKNLA